MSSDAPVNRFGFDIQVGPNGDIEVCYATNATYNKSAWESVNPLPTSLPLFVLQVSLTMFVILIFRQLLKPLRQPRFVAEILAGVLLGPTGIGMTKVAAFIISPIYGNLVLETLANFGLVFYMFIVGLDMNLSPLMGAGKRILTISFAGMLIPAFLGALLHFLLQQSNPEHYKTFGSVFWGVVFSITSFPDLVRTLAGLKLFHTEIGRTALCSAMISEVGGWISLAVVLASVTQYSYKTALMTLAFYIVTVYVISPLVLWLVKITSEEDKYNDRHVCFIVMGALLCGLISDACGVTAIVGAFLFGVSLPKSPLTIMAKERLEGYVTEIMMPPFFFNSGLRTMFQSVAHWTTIIVVIYACAAKIISSLLVSMFFKMSPQKGLALGVLLNTKGVLALIVLNTGRNLKALTGQTFSVMVLSVLVMTSIVEPIIAISYKPLRRFRQYKDRTIEKAKPDVEFRILSCIHSVANISGIINLLQASYANKRSRILVFALRLVELTGHASAMLVMQDAYKSEWHQSGNQEEESDQIFNAFAAYEKTCSYVAMQPLVTASPYASMHTDICDIAEEKRAHLIILPFGKQQVSDRSLNNDNPLIRSVNHNVLARAPCSVGILVDRGHNSSVDEETSHQGFSRILMLFVGGPDDREALSYAWRMSGHPNVDIAVTRFIINENAVDESIENIAVKDDGSLSIMSEQYRREKEIDDDFITEFLQRTEENTSISYEEKNVNNAVDMLAEIREIDPSYDLCIVGRRKGEISPLTWELSEWSDSPELGVLGETLVTSEFAVNVSVLVVQQYSPGKGLDRSGSSSMNKGSKRNLPF